MTDDARAQRTVDEVEIRRVRAKAVSSPITSSSLSKMSA